MGKFSNNEVRLFSFKKIQWYWDVRLWTPIYLLLIILVACSNNTQPTEVYVEPTETIVEEIEVEETTEPVRIFDKATAETIALARLADTVGMGRNSEVKKIIMWVAINRSEDHANGYGASLLDEIMRPKQWQQYDADGVYTEDTYAIAEEVYEVWKTGSARPIYSDMLWFVLNKDGSITVRNQYGEGKNRAEITYGQ